MTSDLGVRGRPVPGAEAAGLRMRSRLKPAGIAVRSRPRCAGPAARSVPGAQATGLTRKSPLKGLETLRLVGGWTESAEVWDTGAPSVGLPLCSPAA